MGPVNNEWSGFFRLQPGRVEAGTGVMVQQIIRDGFIWPVILVGEGGILGQAWDRHPLLSAPPPPEISESVDKGKEENQGPAPSSVIIVHQIWDV